MLEEAEFVRWLDLASIDRHLRGLLFETPDGPMTVLWSRKDGYLLNPDHEPNQSYYPRPEVWQDDSPSKTKLTVPGAKLVEIDCICRRQVLTGRYGRITITLDGAPKIYQGLSARPEQLIQPA